MPDSVMIKFDDVSKTFRVPPGPGRKARVIEAVRAVTASLEAGAVTGVVGPNGAGKTTLFALLLGFLEPTAGAITIAGLAPRQYARKHGANYLPERFQLPRAWTARGALRAFLALDGSTAGPATLLERFDLQEFADVPAHTLSRGTLQRVGIAQAVAVPRSLVVFDEPTVGLDPIWRVRFRELVRGLRSRERTILIASHDLVEIERLADRVLILRAGTITEQLDLRPDAAPMQDYTIVMAKPHDAVADLFDNVRSDGATYTVTVSDATDLSARLAALIDVGGTVVSVNPALRLEDRIVRPRTDSA